MNKKYTHMVSAAMCLALALILPFLTGQIPNIGQMLCPMHIPVLLCGFICGPIWGTAVGAVAPLLRSALTGGMAPPFPTAAVPMAFELAVYGLVSGLLYRLFPKKNGYIYLSLVIAMLCGRVIWGIVKYFMVMANGGTFTLSLFISGAVTESLPGIIIQIILVPAVIMALKQTKLAESL